ncbi:MAG: FkbM family methyltransferase [Pseudomonadota bacterium]|jgi:FkbM family methyltransferase
MSPLEASDIAADFHRALARLNRPGWRKLADPGVGVFLQRWRARRADEPSLRQVSLFFGESMQVALPEVISEQIHAYGLFDPEVSWLALCAVEQGDTVFDVGAHFGYFTLLFSALAGPSGRVLALEPTPSTFAILSANVAGYSRITALNVAAGATSGRLSITDYGLRHSAWNTLAARGWLAPAQAPSPRHHEVDVVTLDECARQRGMIPGFLKIDAENYETQVLEGAGELLERHAPSLLLEAGSDAAACLAQALAHQGYRAFVAPLPGQLIACEDAADAARRHKDVLFAAGERAARLPARAAALAAAR